MQEVSQNPVATNKLPNASKSPSFAQMVSKLPQSEPMQNKQESKVEDGKPFFGIPAEAIKKKTMCKVCKKSFTILNQHLRQKDSCREGYDEDKREQEMEDRKREKSKERMREYRKRKNAGSKENQEDCAEKEAKGRQTRRMQVAACRSSSL